MIIDLQYPNNQPDSQEAAIQNHSRDCNYKQPDPQDATRSTDTLTWPHSLPDPHDVANQTHSRDHTAYLIHKTRPIRHTHVTTQPTWSTRRGQSDTLTWPHSLPDPQYAANQTHSRDHTAYLIHKTRPMADLDQLRLSQIPLSAQRGL